MTPRAVLFKLVSRQRLWRWRQAVREAWLHAQLTCLRLMPVSPGAHVARKRSYMAMRERLRLNRHPAWLNGAAQRVMREYIDNIKRHGVRHARQAAGAQIASRSSGRLGDNLGYPLSSATYALHWFVQQEQEPSASKREELPWSYAQRFHFLRDRLGIVEADLRSWRVLRIVERDWLVHERYEQRWLCRQYFVSTIQAALHRGVFDEASAKQWSAWAQSNDAEWAFHLDCLHAHARKVAIRVEEELNGPARREAERQRLAALEARRAAQRRRIDEIQQFIRWIAVELSGSENVLTLARAHPHLVPPLALKEQEARLADLRKQHDAAQRELQSELANVI